MSTDNSFTIVEPNVFITNKPAEYLPLDTEPLFEAQPPVDNSVIQTYIIIFVDGFNPLTFPFPPGIAVKFNYLPLMNAVSVRATEGQIQNLLTLTTVIKAIYPDQKFRISVQTKGGFIVRVGADHSSQFSGNGTGSLDWRTNINVFVVDTGIDNTHTDLNVVGGTNIIGTPTNWNDDNGHGTHVAGIAGAQDNTEGVVGIAPGVRLWAVKVLDSFGDGLATDIIAGLNWILQNRGVLWTGRGIVNMSLGGPGYDPLDAAVQGLVDAGIVPVVAAGNEAQNVFLVSPARVVGAITVAASEPYPTYDVIATYSNFGNRVDIIAPGTNLTSTYPPNTYATLSGTSMAAPVVSGTIALMLNILSIAGGNTSTFVANVKTTLFNNSSSLTQTNYDGTITANPRVTITPDKPNTTSVSVWAGVY